MGWMLCGLASLAQDSDSGIAPNQPDKHIIAIFRFDPQSAEIGRLETEFAKAREMFLHDLVAEYHSSGLTIQELTAPRFQQFVKEYEQRNPSFPLGAELAAHWAAGSAGEPVLRRWKRELQRTMTVFIPGTNLPPAALGGAEVRVLTNQIEASSMSIGALGSQAVLVPRKELRTLSEARQELFRRFGQEQEGIAAFLGQFLAENCTFDAPLTEQSRLESLVAAAEPTDYQPSREAMDDGKEAAPDEPFGPQPQDAPPFSSTSVAAAALPTNSTPEVIAAASPRPLGGEGQGEGVPVAGPSPQQLLDLSGVVLVLSLILLWVCLRFLEKKQTILPAPFLYPLSADRRSREMVLLTRTDLVPKFMHWLKSHGVQQLLAQREELLSTRQLAEIELAKLERLLIEVEAPLQQKLRGYEQRIADLEDALRAKGNESKELIEMMVRLTRQKLEAEREASAGAT